MPQQFVPTVGSSMARVDGPDKVTGKARYVDDSCPPGVWYGQTVRSPVPSGVLRALRQSPDFDWDRAVLVTAADIPGRNVVTLIEDDQPALVPIGGRIRHAEEALALVAAPSRELARAAAAAVQAEIDETPATLTCEDALDAQQLVYGSDNVFKKLRIERGDDVDAALAGCDLVVESTYRTGAQEQMYIEPQGMLAHWTDDGTCHVEGSLQCPYYVHKALKPLLDLPDDRVVVSQAVTGGGFGGKEEYPSMIAAHAVLLARKAGRPVKLIYDRGEDIAVTTKRHPAIIKHRMGLTSEGRIVAVDIDVVFDGGAYVTLSPVVLSRGVIHAAGPYRIDHVRVVGRVVATNNPPYGAFRGFGAPQTTFAYERQIQKAARQLGIEPFEMRRRNMLREGDITATGQRLEGSVGSDPVLDAVERASQKPSPFPLSAITPAPGGGGATLRRGRGLAFYFHGAGFTGSGEKFLQGRATLATKPSGEFEILTSSTDIGQGALTTFTQIAADALGVRASAIHLVDPSTDKVPDSGPTVASRTCMVVGHVVEEASRRLRRQLIEFAEREGLGHDDLVAVAAAYSKQHGNLAETVTYELPPGIQWDDATYSGSAYPAYGWATCLVDVAVDPDTYEVTVERCIHAIDVGKAIHPVIVKGQIEGGTLQALGWALWEDVQMEKGRVRNCRMTDCIIPTSLDAPEMETILIEVPYAFGPHGAKGVGEIPMDGPGVAVAAAIEDALGVACDALPILPEHLVAAPTATTDGDDR